MWYTAIHAAVHVAHIFTHACTHTHTQLCSTKFGREFLRSKQTYLILREYHKWEEDQGVSKTCEKLIHMLIAEEPEEGMENLHEVDLPEDFSPSQTVVTGVLESCHTSKPE